MPHTIARPVADDFVTYLHEEIIPAALDLLPARMTSREASAMLLAIGLQESRFQHRRQLGPGPARGFWQFERMGGVAGVLTHPMTSAYALTVCDLLRYKPTPVVCHVALEHNDILAAVFARLLLWTDPRALPTPLEATKGWHIYLAQWRPGKPHPATWSAFFAQAWNTVKGDAL